MIYPPAVQELWFPYSPERYITPRSVILHTNASGGAENPGSSGGLSWHFQVGQFGTVYQHRDTETRAAANVQANNFAISIETWDDGSPDVSVPWTPQQMDALVALIGWICDNHNIPRKKVSTWDGWGIGYHRMFSEWNQPVHSCPGDTRAAQFDSELIPRLQGSGDFTMDAEAHAAFDDLVNRIADVANREVDIANRVVDVRKNLPTATGGGASEDAIRAIVRDELSKLRLAQS